MKNFVFILATLGATTSVFAAEIEPSLAVSGSCYRAVKPDLIEVSVGVRVRDNDAKKVTEKASTTYERLLKQVKQLKLADAEYLTTQTSVQKVAEWVKDRNVDRGFEANYAFTVRTSEIARIGDLLKTANDNGANEVNGPQPMLSKKLRQKEYESCLAEAVLNARSKAEIMAQTLNRALSNKVVISESGGDEQYEPRAFGRMEKAGAVAMDAAPTIEVRREDIKVAVSATFYLK